MTGDHTGDRIGDGMDVQMNLIELAKRKNAAWTVLVQARDALYTPSYLGQKTTAIDREIALDHATSAQQMAYNNLRDEYEVRLAIINRGCRNDMNDTEFTGIRESGIREPTV